MAAEQQGLFPREGGLMGALLDLCSHMLSDTVSRLNRVPEKHRIAFLNLCDLPRRPAHPAQTVAVFSLAEGCEEPVTIPSGTLVSTQPQTGLVEFRTRRAFEAVPASLQAVYWGDSQKDMVVRTPLQDGRFEPFTAWTAGIPGAGRHFVDFILHNVFCTTLAEQSLYMTVLTELDGVPIGADVLADTNRCVWSVQAWPAPQDRLPVQPMRAAVSREGRLVLNLLGQAPDSDCFCLRLELLDSALVGLTFLTLEVDAAKTKILPEAILSGDRELTAESFAPFQSPMRAYEECLIFCDDALSRPDSEITIRFTLSFDESEEQMPPVPELIDYKWIMRRPPPPVQPHTAEAFARAVRWEYWNGKTFRELPLVAEMGDFTYPGGRKCRFVRPDDLASGIFAEREGYFLRLSCGGCDELYSIPRRVYSPRMENLRFSFRYPEPLRPERVIAENFGVRRKLDTDGVLRPFSRPEGRRSLFLRLAGVVQGCRLQLYFDLGERCERPCGSVRVKLCGHGDLPVEDATEGFAHSGILTVTVPGSTSESELFGETGCWLCLTPPETGALHIAGIWLNAQWVENRLRHKEAFEAGTLPLSGALQLSHGNIVKLWVYVRQTDGWKRWEEGAEAAKEGVYLADCHTGVLWFSQHIFAHAAGIPDGEDCITVFYDTTEGEGANISAGAVSRLVEEVPFVSGVSNPMPVCDGWNSERDEQLAARTEHWLACGGLAVTSKDFEWLARDCCPLVRDARCISGETVRLIILIKPEVGRTGFYRVREFLLETINNACGNLEILPAVPVPVCCRIGVNPGGSGPPLLEKRLAGFLNPFDGGFHKRGWRLGELPTFQQIEAFLQAAAPQLRIVQLEISACGGGLAGDWRTLEVKPWHIPGTLTVEWEVIADDAAAGVGR